MVAGESAVGRAGDPPGVGAAGGYPPAVFGERFAGLDQSWWWTGRAEVRRNRGASCHHIKLIEYFVFKSPDLRVSAGRAAGGG